MGANINRMQFLRGDLSGKNHPIRPPWSSPEPRFIQQCDRCGDCIPACKQKIIKVGRGDFPEIDFSRGGCDFCTDCVTACKPGAISKQPGTNRAPWTLKATILGSCLSLNSVICRSCAEACVQEAIRFKLEVGGVATPLLDSSRCNGCGECFTVCPNNSVQIAVSEPRVQAA